MRDNKNKLQEIFDLNKIEIVMISDILHKIINLCDKIIKCF